MRRAACFLVFLAPIVATAAEPEPTYAEIAVAADHPAASRAGVEVFKAGGNVVDAAAAVGFALSVVRPESAGLGGGGFMVIWDAEKRRAVAIDYRERAPASAARDMFLGQDGEPVADLSRFGHKASAVPHHVAGLAHAVELYGRLPLRTVLGPALRLAKDGVPLDRQAVSSRNEALKRFESRPEWKERFAAFYRLYLGGGVRPEVGQVVTSPQRPLLERIAAEGAKGFYEGPAAEALAEEMRRGGGLITKADLASVRPTEREPLRAEYEGGTVLTMPPPSSGGVALIEMLQILQAYEKAHPKLAADLKTAGSLPFRHALAESMKHAFADRATFLGDPDYVDVPAARLTSTEYATKLAAKIEPKRTRPLEEYGRASPVADAGTTHFSVIDAAGNAVACTETINLGFGSYVVVPETGLLLNNEMDDFAAKPGVPNAFGLVQSEAAAVGPGRRPLSSMTPTVFVRDGKAVLAVGASGGPKIITATIQVFLNRVRFGMSLRAAVDAPRQHHQWLPNELGLEKPLYASEAAALRGFGHDVSQESSLGVSQIVVRTPEGLHAASDPRKGGVPAGE